MARRLPKRANKILRQDSKGRISNEMRILVTKELQGLADDVGIRVKALVRDELERRYKDNVRSTYTPISETGKAIKTENETKKHQKPAAYHHTGKFLDSIKAVIDDNTVKIVIEEETYDNGTTTQQVYKWLKKGTTDTPEHNSYPYVKKQGDNYSTGWATYNPTPRHPFEEFTLEDMKGFLTTLTGEFRNNTVRKEYIRKYKKHKRGRKEL